jgi:glycogen operon protein
MPRSTATPSPVRAEPLGVTLAARGAQVAIPAPGATRVEVCLFAAGREVARIPLPERMGDVHHGFVADLAAGMEYGLRAHGDWAGRFNPAKLLIDPWARRLSARPALHPTLFDTGATPDGADSGPFAPTALLEAPLPALPPPAPGTGPRIVYELGVRSFTARHPEIPPALRGTFAGLGHPAAIAHLVRLGVTHVELLPVAAWIDERHLPPLGLTNAWGYNPVAFLAPDPRLAPGGMAEVRAAVAALRDAGIGVILDVVFNHSGEGDALGPSLSLKGLGDAAWYRRGPDGAYANDAGCGNTLALDRPWPLRLAMDAMRHWVEQAGVEGFRLDLATTLGRRPHFDADAPLLQAMRQDPLLRACWIIAEPWDIGEDGYRLGAFPPGWGEWNDRFRDDVRRFWRGDAGMMGALATRLAGSADAFPDRPASDSLNFVTAHDGFTLADLVSHDHKHNAANGEQNRDGTDANHSWNHGVEGPTEDPAIQARRAADVRALLATLLLARGTPMLAMGDEAGRSQRGNNNAYAQDHPDFWFDWAGADQGRIAFNARLIAARRAHPALHAAGRLGAADVRWLHPDATPMQDADWHGAAALLVDLRSAADRCLLACNGGPEVPLSLPPARPGRHWRLLADSAAPERTALPHLLPARAVLLLAEASAGPAEDPRLLRRLAMAAGIAPDWHAISGARTEVPPETLRALLGALDLPAGSAAQMRASLAQLSPDPGLPAQWTLLDGTLPLPLASTRVRLTLTDEEGGVAVIELPPEAGETERMVLPDGRHAARRRIPLPLPPGRWRVLLEPDGTRCDLLVPPQGAYLPAGLQAGARGFGLAVQLYALRREADQGIGDFSALADWARAGAREGAALLGLSPPHALFPTDRSRASPYHPSDRRFLDPIFLDVADLPFVADLPAVRAALAQEEGRFTRLRALPSADHAGVWAGKRAVLEAAFAALPSRHPAQAALATFRAAGGPALARFCTWNAIAEAEGSSDCRAWPAGLRHGDLPAVAEFADAAPARVGFHAFLQMLADAQLGAAGAAGSGLYRDLAVGAAPDGAEPWSGDSRFLAGFSIGAPPDPFSAEGQVWGLPPPDLRGANQAAFARLIRANMRHAAALRVDHVLGLKRLFLVPEGGRGRDGAYLAQPFEELLASLALESQRARCLVVGEDLGTVPEGMGAALQAASVLSYRVLWFERHGAGFVPPPDWPAQAAACVATHDLPTLAGFWEGADLAERTQLGLPADEAARAADKAALLAALREAGLWDGPAEPMQDALAAAIHAFVAATPSSLLLVQAEDLAGARIAVNLPGTDRERPNWRARLPAPVAALLATPRAQAILAAIAARRG